MRSPNQRSTWLSQDDPVWGEMRMEPWMLDQPGLDRRCLVGGQSVTDQVDIQFRGYGLVDRDKEPFELLRAAALVKLGDRHPVCDVERREQAGQAVADVVVGIPLGHAGHHR